MKKCGDNCVYALFILDICLAPMSKIQVNRAPCIDKDTVCFNGFYTENKPSKLKGLIELQRMKNGK